MFAATLAHNSTHHTRACNPPRRADEVQNCHNLRPTRLLIVSLITTTDDVIEPAAGSLTLANLRLLNKHGSWLSGKLHVLARS